MMFTFRLSGVYTTRNALSKRSMKPFKVSDIIKVVRKRLRVYTLHNSKKQ